MTLVAETQRAIGEHSMGGLPAKRAVSISHWRAVAIVRINSVFEGLECRFIGHAQGRAIQSSAVEGLALVGDLADSQRILEAR